MGAHNCSVMLFASKVAHQSDILADIRLEVISGGLLHDVDDDIRINGNLAD